MKLLNVHLDTNSYHLQLHIILASWQNYKLEWTIFQGALIK